MGIFVRSLIATLIAIPVLVVFYFLIFPSDGGANFEQSIGFMMIAIFFLGIPLFIVMFVGITILSSKNDANADGGAAISLSRSRSKSVISIAAVGFAIAGVLALLVSGIIWEVWLIFATVGGILGAIIGFFRR